MIQTIGNGLTLIIEGFIEGYDFIVSTLGFINDCLTAFISIWSNPNIPYNWCIPLCISVLVIKFILRKGA